MKTNISNRRLKPTVIDQLFGCPNFENRKRYQPGLTALVLRNPGHEKPCGT